MSTNKRSADFDPDEYAFKVQQEMDDLVRDLDLGQRLADARDVRNANRARSNEISAENARIAEERNKRSADLAQQRLFTNQQAKEASLAQRQREKEALEARNAQSLAQKEQARLDRERRYQENAAYRDAQAEARAQRRAQGQRTGPRFSTGTSGLVPAQKGGPSKEAVARFIVLVTVVSAAVSVIKSVQGGSKPAPVKSTTVNGNPITVPAHLHSLAGAFIAGTVSLIVNEIYPAAGLLFGVGMITFLIVPDFSGTLGAIGSGLFGKAPKASGKPKNAPVGGGGPGTKFHDLKLGWITWNGSQWIQDSTGRVLSGRFTQ
jgi:hypothetical protein